MSTPAMIWLALAAMSLLLNANLHGKPRNEKHSFWTSLIALAIAGSLLYWGGFFAKVAA